MRQDLRRSDAVGNQFLADLQKGDYQSAMPLFSARAVSASNPHAIDSQNLEKVSVEVRDRHGPILSWKRVGWYTAVGVGKHKRHTVLRYQVTYNGSVGRAEISFEPDHEAERITSFKFSI